MNKYVTSINNGEDKTAGTKAHKDIEKILVAEGYEKISIDIPKSKIARVLKSDKLVKKCLENVNKDSMIVYQYPSYSRVLGEKLIKEAKKKSNKITIVTHDVESLRLYRNSPKDIKRELDFFKKFDFIISHNKKMSNWLIENGIEVPIKELEIFDYLNSCAKGTAELNKPIVFAGNLGKSKFLERIKVKKKFEICGIEPSDVYPQNITYKGAFSPDSLGQNLDGSFGLIWDGNSTEKCDGLTGEYMKYNNPHKASLYLSLGIPVIIWREAALAEVVKKKNLGILVDNLDDLDNVLANISENEYNKLKTNALEISQKISEGYFIKQALKLI